MLHPRKGPTPMKVKKKNLAHRVSGYDESESNYLIQCYKNSFYLGSVGE